MPRNVDLELCSFTDVVCLRTCRSFSDGNVWHRVPENSITSFAVQNRWAILFLLLELNSICILLNKRLLAKCYATNVFTCIFVVFVSSRFGSSLAFCVRWLCLVLVQYTFYLCLIVILTCLGQFSMPRPGAT